jgi:hypothetical protein
VALNEHDLPPKITANKNCVNVELADARACSDFLDGNFSLVSKLTKTHFKHNLVGDDG